MFGKLMNYSVKDQKVEFVFEQGKGNIEAVTESIINVFSPYESEEKRSYAVEGSKNLSVSLNVTRENDCVVIKTPKLTVKVYDEFKVDFYDASGKALCKDYRGNRTPKDRISPAQLELMKQEGHLPKKQSDGFRIQIIKELEGDECFYGLGDKTGFLNKKDYAYEMWNTDNPAPQVDSFKALYKSIPFFIALKQECVYGIFLDNTYHSYFDMGAENGSYYYFASDNGNLDYYFIAGDKMTDVVGGYTYLTGTVPLPQRWTLGHQQSRWGYVTEDEVRAVADTYRKLQIPCDVIHLDIDYMDHYKVFTWNRDHYKDPKKMIEDLEEDGFKIVTIIDPGVKKEDGYPVYEEGVDNGYFATTPEGEVYINAVWPGDSAFPDFGSPKVRSWWADNHRFLTDLYVRGIWNDMNEPASFKGPLPDDIVFTDEDRPSSHAKIHNVYGHLMSKATYEGLVKYDNRRPYVITRACYSGSQKYSTVWTGDNHSIWAHLQMAVPQLCNLGLSGMSFAGTDVGGFGSDVTPELMARWVELGSFMPMFRNHSSLGSAYQEPWRFDSRVTDIYRKFVELRYRLVPCFYDLFFEGEHTGLPVMRPLVLHYENDSACRNKNDEFLIGEQLLVSPVLTQGDTQKLVYLPKGQWFDYWTGEEQQGERYFVKEAPLDVCPVYVKAGSILPNYPVQQYIGEKKIEELILDIYPGEGEYHHYQDDGETFDYRAGVYNEYVFTINEDHLFTAQLVHEGYEEKYKSLKLLYKGRIYHAEFTCGRIEMILS